LNISSGTFSGRSHLVPEFNISLTYKINFALGCELLDLVIVVGDFLKRFRLVGVIDNDTGIALSVVRADNSPVPLLTGGVMVVETDPGDLDAVAVDCDGGDSGGVVDSELVPGQKLCLADHAES
jgi:hypothetical protein